MVTRMTQLSSDNLPRLAVSQRTAAEALDVCVDTIENLVSRGQLERVKITGKKWGITWRSLERLVHGEAAS